MKRMIGIGVALCMLALVATTIQAEPKLTISETDFDFGYVPQHATVSHVFWLHSTGSEPLHITKIVPGCSCMRMPIEKDVMSAGDSLRLVMTFDTRMYLGAVTKHPKIYTNQADSVSQLIFHAVATKRPDSTRPVQVIPYKLDISQYADHIRNKIDFKIQNVSDQDLDLSMVAYPSDLVTIDLPSKVAVGQAVSGTVTLKPDAIGRHFERSFTFQVDDNNSTRFTVPIIRKIEHPKKTPPQAGKGK